MHDALDAVSDRDAALVRFAETVTDEEAAVLRRALSTLASTDGNAQSTPRKSRR
jgi:hypothetical protein